MSRRVEREAMKREEMERGGEKKGKREGEERKETGAKTFWLECTKRVGNGMLFLRESTRRSDHERP